MLKHDLEESVGYWLASVHRSYMTALRDQLAPHGITHRQAEILGWIALEGPLSQAELASRMLIEPPSLVGTLDRMEANGLLVRRSCTEDRRKNLIHALPPAERMWEQILDCARGIRTQATAGLTEQEVLFLKNLLKRIHENFTAPESVETAS